MTPRDGWQLAVATVRSPGDAARVVLALQPGRDALWAALVLAAALNALLFSLSNMLLPAPPVLPLVMYQPLVYFAVVLLGLVAFVQLVVWTGRLLGGQGDFASMLTLVVWLQMLRVLVQAAALVLMLTMPLLSLVLVMAASLIGLYILLHFISLAHGLNSLGRAAGALVLAMLALAFAASILIALVGGPIQGSEFNV